MCDYFVAINIRLVLITFTLQSQLSEFGFKRYTFSKMTSTFCAQTCMSHQTSAFIGIHFMLLKASLCNALLLLIPTLQ